MMRIIFLIACCLAVTLNAIAQEKPASRLVYGLHVGGGLSTLAVRGIESGYHYSERSSMQFLGWAQAPLGNHFFLSGEAGFAVKGGVVAYLQPPFPFEEEHSATYGQVNVLLGARLGNKVKLSTGAEFGRLINHESKIILEPERFEIAAALQFEYQVNQRIGLGARGSSGLTPFIAYTTTDENGNDLGSGGEYLQALTLFARMRIGK